MNQILKGAFYITGPAGAGKTTVAKQLIDLGYHAVDGDSGLGIVEGLGKFVDANGNRASEIKPWDEEWKQKYTWLIDDGPFRSALQAHQDNHIFVCMAAHNQYDYFPLFQKKFFLDLSEATLLNRLHNEREHGYGKERFQQKRILDDFPHFRQRMIEEGAIFINAEQPSYHIAQKILNEASKPYDDR